MFDKRAGLFLFNRIVSSSAESIVTHVELIRVIRTHAVWGTALKGILRIIIIFQLHSQSSSIVSPNYGCLS